MRLQWTSVCSNRIGAFALLFFMLSTIPLSSQIDENCSASLQNRSVQVSHDGTFVIPNVPVDTGFFRVRVTCKSGDITKTQGQSQFLVLVPNGQTLINGITLGTVDPSPVSCP